MSIEDLKRHRIAVRFRDFPIYDGEVERFVDEPDWQWDDLDAEQQAHVRQEALRCDGDWDSVFPFTLGDFGIVCPHKWVNREPTFRECRWCRVMEPLPGRVVKVGKDWLRVTDPPPPTLRIPRPTSPSLARLEPSSAPDLAADEYQWTGSHYVLA